MNRVEFTVAGEPVPQGSMRSLGAGRPTIHSNRDELEPWRAAVAAAAAAALLEVPLAGSSSSAEVEVVGDARRRSPLKGPVELRATFVFPRPKAHYGTGRNAGRVKASAPTYCSTRPDLDKLLRAIGDAVTGIVVVDDAQLVLVRAEKHYGSPCAHLAFAEVELEP